MGNMVRFRLEDAAWERLRIFCIKNRKTMQAVCSEAVVEYLKQKKAESRDRDREPKNEANIPRD